MITSIKEFKQYFEKYSHANLYHGIKTEYAINALEKNALDAYSIQRYWADGKRKKDNEPGYKDSYFYRGISLTRDKQYANSWESVIFEFDQQKLKQKYKIIPYNWGYSIGVNFNQNIKREKEEFLIVSKTEKSYPNSKDFLKMLETPGGTIKPLDKYLTGIYINKTSYNIYTDNNNKIYEPFEKIKNHTLYKGLL